MNFQTVPIWMWVVSGLAVLWVFYRRCGLEGSFRRGMTTRGTTAEQESHSSLTAELRQVLEREQEERRKRRVDLEAELDRLRDAIRKW
jgi:hypothetical protein